MKIAVIPARGGSRRIPGKNLRPFHGKPIIHYSIEAAFSLGQMFDAVVVSTDDPVIAECASERNATVLYRPARLAKDEIGTQEVALHAARAFGADVVCCIYATAPLMRPYDIEIGWRHLKAYEHIQYAFAVGTNPLTDAGQFYWSKLRPLATRVHLYGECSVMIPIEDRRVCDINTEEDWARAERMYAELHPQAAAA